MRFLKAIMYVRTVHYRDWRNLAETSAAFSPGINVLWGMNAQGKSNILEGIYFFARGRSFRGVRERELVRFGADFARVSLAFRREGFAPSPSAAKASKRIPSSTPSSPSRERSASPKTARPSPRRPKCSAFSARSSSPPRTLPS